MKKRFLTNRKPRRGGVTLEFILTLPILVIVLLAVFQFGILMIVQQAVDHATTVAAREAGKGEDINTLVSVVNTVLAPHCIQVIDGDMNSDARVVLEVGTAMLPVVTELGDPGLDCDPPVGIDVEEDEVRVTVCVDLSTSPICNLLVSFGAGPDFAGKRFEISSLVKKE